MKLIAILFVLIHFTACSNKMVTNTVLANPSNGQLPIPRSESELKAHEHYIKGVKLRQAGHLNESEEMFKKAYETLTIDDPDYAKGSLANHYGLALIKTQKYKEAIPIIEKALSFNEQSDDKIGIAVSNLNLGDSYFRSGHIEKAIPYWKEAKRVASEVKLHSVVRAVNNRFN